MIAGGAEKALVNLVNALPPDLFDITVCSIFKNSVYSGYSSTLGDLFNHNIRHKYLFNNSTPLLTRLWNILLHRIDNKILHRVLIGTQYDCEIAFYEGAPTKFINNSSNSNSKKFAWLHTTVDLSCPDKSKISEWRNDYLNYTRVIAVSDAIKQSFTSSVGFHEKTQTVYNLLDYEKIRTESRHEMSTQMLRSNPTFVSVGRLCHVKGFDRLIRAATRLNNEGYSFAINIIGDGEDHKALQTSIIQNGLSSKVKLLGHQKNPYPYIAASDGIICSSRIEGFGLSIMEALIIGKPVISVRFKALNEVLSGCNAAIIGDNSDEGLYQAIKTALDNNAILNEHANNAKNFSYSKHYCQSVETIIQLFTNGLYKK